MTRTTARQEKRAATLDDPTFERFRTPRARRRVAAALAAVLVLEAVTLLAADALPTLVWVPAMLVLVVALVLALGTLKASTRGVEELSTDVLDERQAQIRGLVYTRSYTALAATTFVAGGLLVTAAAGWWSAPSHALGAIAVITFQLVITIPTFVAALHAESA